MRAYIEALLAEIKGQLEPLFLLEQKRVESLGNLSALQAGLHDYVRIGYRKGKFRTDAGEMFVEFERPFFWSDSAYKWTSEVDVQELDDQAIMELLLPAIRAWLQPLFESDIYGSRFFDYRLELVLEFERALVNDGLRHEEHWINESKLAALKQALSDFIAAKVTSPPPFFPKDQDMFFFSELLLNADVMEQGLDQIEPLIRQLDEKLAPIAKLRDIWKRHVAEAFRMWADDRFLPQYYAINGTLTQDYTLKPETERSVPDPQLLEQLVYGGMRMAEREAARGKRYLQFAAELGSQQAKRYLAEGSGTIMTSRKTAHMHAKANDILLTVHIKLLSADQEGYRDALQFLIDLLKQGYSSEYSLGLAGPALKELLPVKGLAKSPLHRFFAGALTFGELHDQIAEYAQLAMKEFAWYADVEAGEKSAMPGTYAVLGLALRSRGYFQLLAQYMTLVDTEHQSVHNSFAEAFLQAHGLEAELLPVLLTILQGSGQSARPVKGLADRLEAADLGAALMQQLGDLRRLEREQLLYLMLGSKTRQEKFLKRYAV